MNAAEAKRSRRSPEPSLLAAMREPDFYPHQPREVTHQETHISHLFFAGEMVYKVKKPVRFSFLDYSTLRLRRHFLQEELRLNLRLAPRVYLGIVPISWDGGRWRLGSDVEPAEFALVMRRLPAERMLDQLIAANRVTPEMMHALAKVLAPFHARAAAGAAVARAGLPAAIRSLWEENLSDIRPFVGSLLDAETFRAFAEFGSRFIAEHHALLLSRVREGRVREVHGDLHCQHVCFAPGGIQIFDCLEFSRKLRSCDIASEIAFLVMDLEFRGGRQAAGEFLHRYLEIVNDPAIPALLPFYQCHRALIRGKVAALRSGKASTEAARYFEYARGVTREGAKPFLVMVCGLTGSGKSTLARALGRRLAIPVISSDPTRKALAGTSARQGALPYGEGIYGAAMTSATYARMVEEAERLVVRGEGAVLDATFHRRELREPVIRMAERRRVPLILVWCRAPDEVVRARLAKREEEGLDVSDGRWEIYLVQKEKFEAPDEIARGHCLELPTDASPERLATQVERFLRATLLQAAPAGSD
jgi:uncharacterized protein